MSLSDKLPEDLRIGLNQDKLGLRRRHEEIEAEAKRLAHDDFIGVYEDMRDLVIQAMSMACAAIETAFREGFQAAAPQDAWDQEWEDGEWKVSKSREQLDRR